MNKAQVIIKKTVHFVVEVAFYSFVLIVVLWATLAIINNSEAVLLRGPHSMTTSMPTGPTSQTSGSVTPPSTDALLMEDGSYLLLEDGSKILLE